jgi:hypothetical protein
LKSKNCSAALLPLREAPNPVRGPEKPSRRRFNPVSGHHSSPVPNSQGRARLCARHPIQPAALKRPAVGGSTLSLANHTHPFPLQTRARKVCAFAQWFSPRPSESPASEMIRAPHVAGSWSPTPFFFSWFHLKQASLC